MYRELRMVEIQVVFVVAVATLLLVILISAINIKTVFLKKEIIL